MTLGDFKKAVYAYIGREPGADTTGSDASLVQHGVDLVLMALNQARLKAQREYDFEAMHGVYGAQINRYGTSLDSFVTIPEGAVAQVMKNVTGVFEYTLSGSSVALGEAYDFQDRGEIIRTGGRTIDREYVYVRGRKLYLEPVDELTWVAVTGGAFLADLTNSDLTLSTDFFLKYGYDWLLLATIRELNLLVKEDQRYNIPKGQLDDAWRSLIKFDYQNGNWGDMD